MINVVTRKRIYRMKDCRSRRLLTRSILNYSAALKVKVLSIRKAAHISLWFADTESIAADILINLAVFRGSRAALVI